jgi:polysaccharide chain length determinant protein (PEP-CTERM system associated)
MPERLTDLEIARAMWHRRKWLAVVVCIWTFGAAAAATRALPNVYRATATFLIERQYVSEALVTPLVTNELETRLHTFSQQVLSRDRLDALIGQFDLYPELRAREPEEAVLEQMRRDIGFELTETQPSGAAAFRGWPLNIAIGFRLSYLGTEPHKAADVTNALAAFYVNENAKLREQQASGTTEFLRTQLDDLKDRMARQSAQLNAYKDRHTGELPEMQDANLKTLERLNMQLQLNTENQRRAMERRDLLTRQLAEEAVAPTTEVRNPAVARLAELRRRLGESLARYSERHPEVVRLRAEIATVEDELAAAAPQNGSKVAEPDTGGDTILARFRDSIGRVDRAALAQIDVELTTLRDEEQRLRQTLATYEQRVENSPRREGEFRELSREYDATTELYNSLLKRYEDARLAENMEERGTGDTIRILDRALPPSLPIAPDRLSLWIMSLVLAIVLGVAAIVVAERLDTTFHSIDDLRTFTRIPVAGAIPRIVTARDLRRARWRFCAGVFGAVCGLALIVLGSSYLTAGNDQLVRLLARGGV